MWRFRVCGCKVQRCTDLGFGDVGIQSLGFRDVWFRV